MARAKKDRNMDVHYLAQRGEWSPRDKAYVWKTIGEFKWRADAVKTADGGLDGNPDVRVLAWRVLRVEVTDEHAPKEGRSTDRVTVRNSACDALGGCPAAHVRHACAWRPSPGARCVLPR